MAYTGNSIVDFLSSSGQDSSFASRKKLYEQSGLNLGGYAGTAQQNTSLLNNLRGGGQTATTAATQAPVRSAVKAPTPTAIPRTTTISAPQLNIPKFDSSELLGRQKAETEAYLQRYRDKTAGQETMTDAIKRYEGELGLPQARQATTALNQAIIDLEQTLSDLPQNVANQKRGFDVNAAQLAEIQASRQQPLLTQLNDLGRSASRAGAGLSAAEQALATRLQGLGTDFQRQLEPFALEGQLLGDRMARELTGFTNDMQTQFNMLLEQWKTGVQLNEAQAQRLHELAMAENSYERQKELIGIQSAAQNKLDPMSQMFNDILLKYKPQIESYVGQNLGGVLGGQLGIQPAATPTAQRGRGESIFLDD